MTCPALQFLILTVAGGSNRERVAVVAYLIEENRTLRDQLQGRRAAPHRRPASEERNHQGLDDQLLAAPAKVTALAAPFRRRERVGGVLNDYYREAA